MKIKTSVLAGLAAAVVGVQVGSAMVATRFVIDYVHPGSLAFLRYSIGMLCLLLPLLVSSRVPFDRKDILPLSLLGITQFGIVITLLNYALQFIPSARASVIFATLPLQTMAFATLLGYERLTFIKSIGVFLTMIGVGFVFGERIFYNGNSQGWAGEIAAFLSAFAAAACSVLYRPYLRKYPTLQITGFAMFASIVFLAVLAAREGFFNIFPHFGLTIWLAILFIGVSSGIGYYLWLWALKNTSPTKATIFLSLNPVTAAVLGFFFLGERITITLLTGIFCVILGLCVAHLNIDFARILTKTTNSFTNQTKFK